MTKLYRYALFSTAFLASAMALAQANNSPATTAAASDPFAPLKAATAMQWGVGLVCGVLGIYGFMWLLFMAFLNGCNPSKAIRRSFGISCILGLVIILAVPFFLASGVAQVNDQFKNGDSNQSVDSKGGSPTNPNSDGANNADGGNF